MGCCTRRNKERKKERKKETNKHNITLMKAAVFPRPIAMQQLASFPLTSVHIQHTANTNCKQ
jgi:hypothetical protein